MSSVLQKDIEYFIEDFETKSEIELIEGKEKSELEKIAEVRGMSIKGSRDLAIFKTIYGFTNRPNSNGAVLPQKELLKVQRINKDYLNSKASQNNTGLAAASAYTQFYIYTMIAIILLGFAILKK